MENFLILGKACLLIYALLFLVLVLHELIHLLFILLFKKKVISINIHPFGGKVVYENDHQYGQIFWISTAPNLILPFIGGAMLYFSESIYSHLFSMLCILNLFNFVPFTGDGSAILYSALKWWEEHTQKTFPNNKT
ncbi:Putative zincin peptidase [Halobacillus karajensis]|uniref:Zn-dependent proteases n=1 Tax=Halobacillus karajensis TaxID=195088 RepID=A0A024P5K2_9BACI|nr:Zn-dependent proteases [Halobacillus karajensis]CDQ23936.1 Zn-dependent proteases [Halobacillus karajensis]CDQ27414.1 Zn-dependent proteases [Halobacillus karajensis]SEH89097.1 Putative zincin peptidase [Halobacillus karajensis]